MSKRLIVVLALAFVVGITAAAFAEVQNVKISGDMTAAGVIRNNLSFIKNNLSSEADADGWITISRIKVDANLTDNVDVTFRLLNERGWGAATGNTGSTTSTSEVDVAQAFVTFKEMMKDTVGFPWTMIVGKQSIKIGTGLLIGAAGTNQSNTTQLPAGLGDFSTRASFDAIVNVMDLSPITLTSAFVKASEGSILAGNDTNVYVVDAAFGLGENMKNAQAGITYVLSAQKKNNINNLGGRISVSPMENVGVESEYVYQTAKKGNDGLFIDEHHKTKASDAFRLAASLGLPDVVWAPKLAADFERLSMRWNVMHESWTPADLANLIFPNSDVQCIGATISAKPMDDLGLKFRYANFALAKKDLSSFTSAGTGATYTMDPTKKDLGNEFDLGLAYDYTADVQFGFKYGYFKPGKAFAASNRTAADQWIGSMKVSF